MAELPERLREAADAHRPDRERMLARVERAMAAPEHGVVLPQQRERPPAPWMRVTAVAAAVAGAVGLGGLAVGAVSAGSSDPARTVVTSGGSGSAHPGPVGSGTSGETETHPSPAKHPTTPRRHTPDGTHAPELPGTPATTGRAPDTSTPSAGAGDGAGDGSGGASTGTDASGAGGGQTSQTAPPAQNSGVTSVGGVDTQSNPYWMQSDVNLTNSKQLTSLTVELRVARTSGVSSTGSFTSISGQSSASITVEGDDLVYRWTLNPGQTLQPGSYIFAGQFGHTVGDRDTTGDRYTVTGSGPGGPVALSGGF